ncbi:MAG: HDOD domain-containing protein [Myxococcales bacterium FL481]|nr:MAG: HDOD domain-containing protein [Myxococcales bacterium FL481]
MSNAPTRARCEEDVLRDSLRARVEGAQLKLPLLPEVAQRVLGMAGDPSAGVADLARLINRDPSLCAHVLRAANSPWYCRGSKIVSIRQALAQLGAENLSQIAWTIAMGTSLLRSHLFKAELDRWWAAALAASLVAKDIARSRRSNVETAFLCGMMARIGRPVVYEALTLLVDELELSPGVAVALADDLVRQYERPAGLMLVAKWNMPPAISDALQGLERIGEVAAQEHAALAQISQRMADELLASEDVDVDSLAADPAGAILNLYPDVLQGLVARRGAILSSIEAIR